MKKLFPIKSLTDKKIRKKIVKDMDRGIVTLQKELHCFFPDWNKVMLLSLYVEISELLREKNDKVIEYLNVLYLKGEWELLNYYIRG